MSLALNDLRVVDSMDGDYVTINRVSRPATPEDVLTLAASLITRESYLTDSMVARFVDRVRLLKEDR